MINKIVSTSVFGSNPRYIVGAKRQALLAKHYYPGWEFRVYTDNPDNFAGLDVNVVHINDGTNGTLWRFFPLFESDANITIVRDADSRITAREAMAVYEWMSSDKRFHNIKDHETHDANPILSGMLGLKGKLGVEPVNAIFDYLYGEKKYGEDERYLKDHVYPFVRGSTIGHHWKHGWFGLSRKFLQNKYEFVGNGWYEDEKPIYAPTMDGFDGFDGRALPDSANFGSYPVKCK